MTGKKVRARSKGLYPEPLTLTEVIHFEFCPPVLDRCYVDFRLDLPLRMDSWQVTEFRSWLHCVCVAQEKKKMTAPHEYLIYLGRGMCWVQAPGRVLR